MGESPYAAQLPLAGVLQALSLAYTPPPTCTASDESASQGITLRDASLLVAVLDRRRRRRLSGRAQPRTASGVVFDLVVFLVVAMVLVLKYDPVGDYVYEILGYNVRSDTIKSRVEWIMARHAPLGFKLNPRVDVVLGSVVILVLDAWQFLTGLVAPFSRELGIVGTMAIVLLGIATSGSVASLGLALIFDVVGALVAHVSLLHRMMGRLHRHHLSLTKSLGLLILGKKRNLLRSRVDGLRSDSTRLMLGTVAFSLCLLTLPTTLAYHVLIFLVWSLVWIVQSLLWLAVVFLETFPDNVLFGFDPASFPSMGKRLERSEVEDELPSVVEIPATRSFVLSKWFSHRVLGEWKSAWRKNGVPKESFLAASLLGRELCLVPTPCETSFAE